MTQKQKIVTLNHILLVQVHSYQATSLIARTKKITDGFFFAIIIYMHLCASANQNACVQHKHQEFLKCTILIYSYKHTCIFIDMFDSAIYRTKSRYQVISTLNSVDIASSYQSTQNNGKGIFSLPSTKMYRSWAKEFSH